MKTILLATDGSDDSAFARAAAADLSMRARAELVLLTVVTPVSMAGFAFAGLAAPGQLYQELQEEAATLLRAERSRIEAAGRRVVENRIATGVIGDAITSAADEVEADLIITGNRGLHWFGRALGGSVSESIVHHSHRPVLIVRGPAEVWPPTHVVVGFDHSPPANRAAYAAVEIARLYPACSVSLVQAVPHATPRDDVVIRYADVLGAEEGHLQAHADRLAAHLGRPINALLCVDDPADALAFQARRLPRSTLVAVGTRGMGTLHRLVEESVSGAVLHTVGGCVLIAPADAAWRQRDIDAA